MARIRINVSPFKNEVRSRSRRSLAVVLSRRRGLVASIIFLLRYLAALKGARKQDFYPLRF
jgi:hypothetical protein